MKNFFLSLKTTVWLLTTLIVLFFAGSSVMPVNREIFGPMNELLLVRWLVDVAAVHPLQTWWFFASLLALALLTVNTLVCSIQAIKGRWSREDAWLRIAPQIVHIGFLFILLAHLLGALSGYKTSGMVPEGAYVRLPEDRVLHLRKLIINADAEGYVAGWSADVQVIENDRRVASGILAPNKPLFYKGAGIYLKNFDLRESPMAFMMVTKDPGAIWALVGAILFTLGICVILALKWKKT
jgi:cytochrome c biogenesis protein ResB